MTRLRPLCVLHGSDGFDMCVLRNITHFYRRLGFAVVPCLTVVPCDLLVILRGSQLRLPEHFPPSIPVHFFNYGGMRITAALVRLAGNGNPVTLIEPVSTLREPPPANTRLLNAFPPVYPELWAVPPARPAYPLTHVGNRKAFASEQGDPYSLTLDRLVAGGAIDVWGHGWAAVAQGLRLHGSCRIYTVPHLFARSGSTLGLMAPFQRESGSFTTRFWMAPLCGTRVLSEPNRYCGQMPGVLACAYEDASAQATAAYDRAALADDARRYWCARTGELTAKLAYVGSNVARQPGVRYPLTACIRHLMGAVYRRVASRYERLRI